MKWHRVYGMMLRHWYSFRHTPDRIIDVFYWPAVDVVLWGLTIVGLQKVSQANASSVTWIVCATIMWHFVNRGQADIGISFLEELWDENLSNILATSLKLKEWILSLCLMSVLKVVLTITFASVLSYILYGVNFLSIGFVLLPLAVILTLFSWALGMFMCGLFLRFGTNIQILAWTAVFILMPFSAVYFQAKQLPALVQAIGSAFPPLRLFEVMRSAVLGNAVDLQQVLTSFELSLLYLLLAGFFFYRSYVFAKKKGLGSLR